MLIDFNTIKTLIKDNNFDITGVLHIGAHECEEMGFYKNTLGVNPNDIIWIDAIEIKVNQSLNNGIPNVYHAVISDKDDEIVDFHISNNGQSSSMLELKTHLYQHPDVYYINTIKEKTVTIDTFFKRNGLSPEKYVFWNFDIQGAELLALKGASDAIKYAKVIYLEVNEDELYKNCARIQEIDSFLKNCGFKREHKVMWQNAGWGDAIYIRHT